MEHNQSPWQPPPARPALDDELQVWLYDLERCGPQDPALLSAREQDRARRLVQSRARRQYVAAQVLLRRLLGEYLEIDPGAVVFERGPQGKPFLANHHGAELHFNLSHSGNWLLVALVRGREVGVDLEVHRSIDTLALAERFFCAGETRQLNSLPDPARQRRHFFDLWTAKEALVKAMGTGIAGTLNRFELSLEPSGIQWRDHTGQHAADQWCLLSLPAPDGCSAALAVERQLPTVRYFQPRP